MKQWHIVLILIVIAIARGFVSNLNTKGLRRIDDGVQFALGRFIFVAAITAIIAGIWFMVSSNPKKRMDATTWKISALSGSIAALIGLVLIVLLKYLNSASVMAALFTPLAMSSTIIIGTVWLKEKLTSTQIVGIALSLVSVIILTIAKQSK